MALRQNLDLRIAAARIVEAEAQLGVTRADQFPTVDGHAEVSRTGRRGASSLRTRSLPEQSLQLTGPPGKSISGVSTAGDRGRTREPLATEWGRRAVATNLVAQVASAYFELRSLDCRSTSARELLRRGARRCV